MRVRCGNRCPGPQDVEQEVREATKNLYLSVRMDYYSFFLLSQSTCDLDFFQNSLV